MKIDEQKRHSKYRQKSSFETLVYLVGEMAAKGFKEAVKGEGLSKCNGVINVQVNQFNILGDSTAEKFSVKLKSSVYEHEQKGGTGFFNDSYARFGGMCEGDYEIIVTGCDRSKKCKSAKIKYKFSGGSKWIIYSVEDGSVREEYR